ncbi:MAG: hypothetical protein H0X37_08010 [Herpetosiphonaceae bacterium]|nr:hypothetical protein [Herpetosiphonaceae bacterium]
MKCCHRFVGLFVLALLITACGASSNSASNPITAPSASPAGATTQAVGATVASTASTQPSGQFIIGSLEEPGNLSPLIDLSHHFPEHVPQTMMFDSLIQFMPDSTIHPKLAASWDISPDGKVYTFKLNPKAKWWDGSPVTADDVKFTFDAMMNDKTGSSIEGVEPVDTVVVVDAQTVKITLKALSPLFLAQGGSRGIVPSKLLKGQDLTKAEFNRKPMGSGPYKFVSWQQGSALVLEANTDYFQGVPQIGRIIFKVLPNQNVILTQLKSGEINYALIGARDLEPVKAIPGTKVYENPSPRFFDIAPNYKLEFFADRNVREALLTGIDRQGIVDKVLQGHGVVIDSNAAPASWAYNPNVPKHPYDPAQAKKMLAAAGYTPGPDGILAKNGKPLKFTVMINAFDATLQQVLTVAQQELKDIGVTMIVGPVEAGVFNSRRSKGDFDALSRVWNPVYDPDQDGLNKTGNFYGYSNPQVDQMGKAALAINDQAARKKLYLDEQVILSKDVTRLWLYSENELHAVNLPLVGPQNHPVNFFWNLWQWEIKK